MRTTFVACGLVAASLVLGCESKPNAKGPAEQAGESVDNAAEQTKEGVHEGTQAVKDAAVDLKNRVEDHDH